MTARKTFQPYGEIITLLDRACQKLAVLIEDPETGPGERTRLSGSRDSIRFERKIISGYEMSKTEATVGNRRKPL